MSCSNRTLNLGPQVVWSYGSALMFHPMSAPMDSNGIAAVRAILELEQRTANTQIKLAFRYSNDGMNWDAPNEIGSPQSSNGVLMPTGWSDIVTGYTPKILVQFGVTCIATSGSANELGVASLRLDTRP